MLWTILIAVSIAVLALLLVILLLPVRGSIRFSISPDETSYSVLLSWIHPRVVMLTKDNLSGGAAFLLFGRVWGKKNVEEVVPEPPPKKSEPEAPGETRGPSRSPLAPSRDLVEPGSLPEVKKPLMLGSFDKGEDDKRSSADGKQAPEPLRRRISALIERIRANPIVFVLGQFWWHKKILRWLGRCMRSLKILIRFDHLRCHAKTGFEDPAVMGKAFGIYHAVKGAMALDARRNISLTVEPLFMKSEITCTGSLAASTSGARLIVPVIIALCSFPYLSTFLIWRRTRRLSAARTKNEGSDGAST